MTAAECVIAVSAALDRLGIPFMIVGSFSSNVYGIARSTKDADFAIQLGDRSIGSLAAALASDFILDAQLAFETATGTTKFRLTHRDTEFTIELFALRQNPHDQSRFARRVLRDIGGQRVYVPTAEDVVITKLVVPHKSRDTGFRGVSRLAQFLRESPISAFFLDIREIWQTNVWNNEASPPVFWTQKHSRDGRATN